MTGTCPSFFFAAGL